jgi:anti-sigma factor ChrR (cupin superfamily)
LGDPAELAALYAAGAMELDERAAFEVHLAEGCEMCRAELARLGGVVAGLAAAALSVPPDPRSWEALLARVAGTSASSPLRPHLQLVAAKSEAVLKRADDAVWEDTEVPGVRIRTLFVDAQSNHFTALVRMAPGSSYPGHIHGGPEECFVLEGDLDVGEQVMRAGDYQRVPAGSRHAVQSTKQGCLLLITSSLSDVFV